MILPKIRTDYLNISLSDESGINIGLKITPRLKDKFLTNEKTRSFYINKIIKAYLKKYFENKNDIQR